MKKGEFLQFLNHSNRIEKKLGLLQTEEALHATRVDLIESRNTRHLTQRLNVESMKSNHNCKRFIRAIQPLQLSKKALGSEDIVDSSVPMNEPCCEEVQVIRRPGALNVKMINYINDDIEQIDLIHSDDKLEQVCTLSQECDDSITYHPSTFSTVQV